MNLLYFYLVFYIPVIYCVLESIQTGPLYQVEVGQGEKAELPCDISMSEQTDNVLLVIWYKDGIGSSIYTYESRKDSQSKSRHWSDSKTFGRRAYFDVKSSPSSLVIENVNEYDKGLYRCRVDFKRSPTRNARTNLDVIVPPKHPPVIYLGDRPVDIMVGPYDEGARLTLRCDVIGGRPSPQLSWWMNNDLIDSTYEIPKIGVVRNILDISSLTRKHLHSSLTCLASNGNTSTPKETHVSIEMNFKPLSVEILKSRGPLTAGRTFELSCQSIGARPPALITWLLNGQRLNGSTIKTTSSSNVTTGILYITPKSTDEGKVLTCSAESPVIKHSPLRDDWTLRVNYIPILRIKLGLSLNISKIKEGDDIYFDCEIEANPKAYKIEWYHQGIPVEHDIPNGIIISNQTLVIQKVQKQHSGVYTCTGSNTEGDGESNAFTLNVKYKPVCADDQSLVYGAARYEKVTVSCLLEAVPGNVTFSWRFNNSGDVVDIAENHIATNGLQSSLSYVAKTELDFGTLLCWGRNELGIQRTPCSFQVVPAGPPETPNNCTVTNASSSFLHIKCLAGYDGGLDQTFAAEVYPIDSELLLYNVSLSVPYFKITSLEQGSSFKILVYSFNSKGYSKERVVTAYTLKDVAEKRTAPVRPPPEDLEWPLTPLLAVCVGVVGSLLLVIIIGILVIRLNKDKRKHPHGKITLSVDNNPNDKDLEELNPDVIPEKNHEASEVPLSRDECGFIPVPLDENRIITAPYAQQICSTLPRPAKGHSQPNLQAGDLMYAELLPSNKSHLKKISNLRQTPVYSKLSNSPLINGGITSFISSNDRSRIHSNYYSPPYGPSDHHTELLMEKCGRSVKNTLRPLAASPLSQPSCALDTRRKPTGHPSCMDSIAYEGYIPPPAFVIDDASVKDQLLSDRKESEV